MMRPISDLSGSLVLNLRSKKYDLGGIDSGVENAKIVQVLGTLLKR